MVGWSGVIEPNGIILLGYFLCVERAEFMKIQGLEVKGLDVVDISQKLAIYVAEYFNGYKLGEGESMFMEGHMFEFDEIKDIVPSKHHHLFTDESRFNGMSGYIIVGCVDGKKDERVISLLMDEDSEYAYLLCLHETKEKEDDTIILIKDFLN